METRYKTRTARRVTVTVGGQSGGVSVTVRQGSVTVYPTLSETSVTRVTRVTGTLASVCDYMCDLLILGVFLRIFRK